MQELKLIRRRNQEGTESANSNITQEGSPANQLTEVADTDAGVKANLQSDAGVSSTAIATGTDIFSALGGSSAGENRTDQEREEQGDDNSIRVPGNAPLPGDRQNS